MKTVELSKFQPTPRHIPGGIKTIMGADDVVPVAGDTTGLSGQAIMIHEWLLETYGNEQQPISARRVIQTFGKRVWQSNLQTEYHSLGAFPMEELQDASLLYVVEDDN